MSRKITIALLTAALLPICFLPLLIKAESSQRYQTCDPNKSLTECQQTKLQQISNTSYQAIAGPQNSSVISQKIGLIISYILGFLGVIFLILTIYSGFQWLTAGGNEETIKKARSRLINAVIGLAIILSAYAITYFVTEKLAETSGYSTLQTAEDCQPNCCLIDPTTPTSLNLCQPNESCKKTGGGDPNDPCVGCACVPNN